MKEINVDSSIWKLAKAYRTGQLFPSEVIDNYLKNIDKADQKLQAFEVLAKDKAIAAADKADKIFVNHKASKLLLGIPFAVKDIFDVNGFVTGNGQKRANSQAAQRTATVVERLFAAGAIMLGKTKTVEIAMGGWGINSILGTPWNPWDEKIKRVPGGSSSGSAVAVAAGLSPFAIGSDTGGSVRLPAAFCGVVGLNVTANLLPTEGIMPLSRTFDTPGPITNTVLDAAILFQVMRGDDIDRIKKQLEEGVGFFSGSQSNDALEGYRLGAINDFEREFCTDDVLRAYDFALEKLVDQGAIVEKISPRLCYSEIAMSIGDLINSEAFSFHGDDYQSPDFPTTKYVRDRILAGANITLAHREEILEHRKQTQIKFFDDIDKFHAIITPTTPTTAIPVSTIQPSINVSHFTRPINFLGMCALAVPIDIGGDGLPTSLQIAARAGEEDIALHIGVEFEKIRGPFRKPQIYEKHLICPCHTS
ncbi:MAG: amidase [Rhodospirillaceae bacterium]|nr:amidase [Rhodospirillaceae bacterium]